MVSPSSWVLCNSNQHRDFFQRINKCVDFFVPLRSCPPCKVESILSLCSESSCSMGGRSILPGFLWRTWSSWWWLRRHHCALYLVTWRHLSWKARGWILLAQCWGLSWGWSLWRAREWYSSGDSSETACSYFFILKIWAKVARPSWSVIFFNFGGVNGQPRGASDGRNLAKGLECTTPL